MRGGKRKGAGRKPAPTKVINFRVPISYWKDEKLKSKIKGLIKEYIKEI